MLTHAGGIIRAVLNLAGPRRPAAGQVAETPAREWSAADHSGRYREPNDNDRRAYRRRVERRRARKGYAA